MAGSRDRVARNQSTKDLEHFHHLGFVSRLKNLRPIRNERERDRLAHDIGLICARTTHREPVVEGHIAKFVAQIVAHDQLLVTNEGFKKAMLIRPFEVDKFNVAKALRAIHKPNGTHLGRDLHQRNPAGDNAFARERSSAGVLVPKRLLHPWTLKRDLVAIEANSLHAQKCRRDARELGSQRDAGHLFVVLPRIDDEAREHILQKGKVRQRVANIVLRKRAVSDRPHLRYIVTRQEASQQAPPLLVEELVFFGPDFARRAERV